MPNYEYLCKKCGHRFEQIRKFFDKQLRKCPECGGVIEQVISAPAVQFKGSGWYVTDYAGKKGSSAESGAAAGSGNSDKSDSKDSSKDSTKESAKESSSKESSTQESKESKSEKKKK